MNPIAIFAALVGAVLLGLVDVTAITDAINAFLGGLFP